MLGDRQIVLYVYATYSLFEASGKIGRIDFGNNTTTNYTYQPYTNRLDSIMSYGPGGVYQNKVYDYSLAGDVTMVDDQYSGVTYNYTYDALHRLTSETSIGSPDAPVANGVIRAYENTFPLHAPSSATISGEEHPYDYDSNGNMILGPDFSDPLNVATRSYTYDANNMPVSIDHTAYGSTNYVYDGNGVRAKKVVNGTSSTFYVSEYYEIKDSVATKHIFAGDTRIAMVRDGQKYFFHKDHLGSSTVTTYGDGYSMEETGYLPYGGERDSYKDADATEVNYKYTDQEHDPETGLYNYNARLYDPWAGQFITPDSIIPDYSNPQSLNRYSYTLNNPMRYIDPTGHWTVQGAWNSFTNAVSSAWSGVTSYLGSGNSGSASLSSYYDYSSPATTSSSQLSSYYSSSFSAGTSGTADAGLSSYMSSSFFEEDKEDSGSSGDSNYWNNKWQSVQKLQSSVEDKWESTEEIRYSLEFSFKAIGYVTKESFTEFVFPDVGYALLDGAFLKLGLSVKLAGEISGDITVINAFQSYNDLESTGIEITEGIQKIHDEVFSK